MRHFRLRGDEDERLFPHRELVANVTLCKIDLDKHSKTLTTRDWKEVTCPKCLKEKAECDKIERRTRHALKD